MMFEAYTGTRAGRPTVLLLLSAGALVVAVGLAWSQVYASRGLADAVAIPGTPLVVRPPMGWVQHPERPNVFIKTIVFEALRRKREVAERTLEFHYRRWPIYQPWRDLLGHYNDLEQKAASAPAVGRIANLRGVQVRRERNFRLRGREQYGESIYRLVTTARGDEVSVEYTPLGGLSPGDLDLFDAVCRSLKIDDPSLRVKPEEALEHAGVRFPLAADWQIIGPDFPEVHGLYVQNDESGIATWGLAVFRTWLAPQRSGAEILATLVAHRWPREAAGIQARQSTRPDGTAIAEVHGPPDNHPGGEVTSAWVVAKSPAEAVMILALADDTTAAAADQAAEKLADEIQFVTPYPADGVDEAIGRGSELVALFEADGVVSWWGDRELTLYYYGNRLTHPGLVVDYREALGGNAARGYQGLTKFLYAQPGMDEEQSWTLDATADGFTRRVGTDLTQHGEARGMRLEESRKAGEATLHRVVRTGGRYEDVQIRVGPAFVPPPLETLVEHWVAQQEVGTWLIEVAPTRGVSTAARLLMPLDPDSDGHRRALSIEDFWPRGAITIFDEDGELHEQASPSERYTRISPEQFQRFVQRFRR